MSKWYDNKINKEAAVAIRDFVYEVYLRPLIGKSISQFDKNTPDKFIPIKDPETKGNVLDEETGEQLFKMPSGSRFSLADKENWDVIVAQGKRTKQAQKDVVDFVKFKYGKAFKKAYETAVLTYKKDKDKDKLDREFDKIRKSMPVTSKLLNNFQEEWFRMLRIEFITTSDVIDNKQIYEDLIAPELYRRREKGEVIFIYEKSSFSQFWHKYEEEIGRPMHELRDPEKKNIVIKKINKTDPVTGLVYRSKEIVSHNEEILEKIVEGFFKVNDKKLGELQAKALYEISDSTKAVRSFHEFAIRDILAICGVDFDIEIPFKMPESTLYVDPPVIDFVLPGQELFEVFGDSRSNYDERKSEKIKYLPNLWYIDYAEQMSRQSLVDRTLTMYCTSLNENCYFNQDATPSQKSLQGKDYVGTLKERVPLIGIEHVAILDFYWRWTMDLDPEYLAEIRSKIKEMQKSPEYEPLPMTTAQYNMQDYVNRPPSLGQIFSELVSGGVAEGAQSFSFPDGGGFSPEFMKELHGHELIALYFQTPEAIMPYLQQISEDIDIKLNQRQPQEELIQDPSVQDEQDQPYDFTSYNRPYDPSMLEIQEEPRLRAAKSDKVVKTASIDLSEKDFNDKIKELISNSSFFERLFNLYDVPLEAVDKELKFHIVSLDGRHAKSKNNDIYINSKLMKDNDSVEEVLHFVVHEMTHWLTRQREKMCYFSDPEELEAFALGMAFELRRGQNEDQIREIYFPIIDGHFKEDGQAEKMYKEFLKSAYILNKNIFS